MRVAPQSSGVPSRAAARGEKPSRVWVWTCLLALGTLVLFAGCTWARLRSNDRELFVSDGYYYYSYLPAWFVDHSLDLTNAYRHRPDEAAGWGYRPTATGRPSSPFGIGMAVLLSPAFLL